MLQASPPAVDPPPPELLDRPQPPDLSPMGSGLPGGWGGGGALRRRSSGGGPQGGGGGGYGGGGGGDGGRGGGGGGGGFSPSLESDAVQQGMPCGMTSSIERRKVEQNS